MGLTIIAALLTTACADLEGRFGCQFDSDCKDGRICHPTLECVDAAGVAEFTARFSFAHADSSWIETIDVGSGQPQSALSEQLEAVTGLGDHALYDVTADARWVVLNTDCGDSCIMLVDLERQDSANLLPRMRSGAGCPDGENMCSPGEYIAVAGGGRVVVWGANIHSELIALHRVDRNEPLGASIWDGGTQLLTGIEPPELAAPDKVGAYTHFQTPHLSPNGSRILFSCGNGESGWIEEAAICEAATDGSGTQILLHPQRDEPTPGLDGEDLRNAHYTRQGGIVFEADWGAQVGIWHYEGSVATRVTPVDESWLFPCPLPDGRVLAMQTEWSNDDDHYVGTVAVIGAGGPIFTIAPLNTTHPYVCHL